MTEEKKMAAVGVLTKDEVSSFKTIHEVYEMCKEIGESVEKALINGVEMERPDLFPKLNNVF